MICVISETSLFSIIGKIYSVNLAEGVCWVTEELIAEEKGSFRSDRRCSGQVFTLKQISEIQNENYIQPKQN